MKAILLALAAGTLLFGLGTWRLRVAGARGAATLLTVFFAVLPVLVLVHVFTPADLWLFPVDLQIQPAAASLAFALFLYAAGFFGGILQLYNLAERGLSLRMLIDILRAPDGRMTADDMVARYSAGRGIGWMYAKRVQGMVSAGLVVADGRRLTLTARGAHVAYLFGLLQRFARAEEP
jgi:hypothetical protein